LPTEPQTAFISYSREDSEFALRLAGDLKAAGATVWLDQLDIAPGQRWARAVEDALNDCPRMLVILSPSSANSTNVDDEVSFALEEHKTVIPVLYRDCKIPFRLRPFQFIDFRGDYGAGLKMLLRSFHTEPAGESGAPVQQGVPDPSIALGNGAPTGAQRTWKKQISGTDEHLFSVTFPTEQLGWAVGPAGTILHTEDGGTHWGKQASDIRSTLYWVTFQAPQRGWATGANGMILHTKNGGRTWTQQAGATNVDLASVTFATPYSGWAVGFRGSIRHTNDAGENWKEQISDTQEALFSVCFAGPQSACAVGWEGICLQTKDGGSTWMPRTSGTDMHLLCVTFATPSSGWAVGLEGTILHTEDAGDTWTPQIGETDEDPIVRGCW